MTTKRKSAAIRFLQGITGGLTFRSLLEAIRVGEQMTQEEFAKKLGVSRAHLCDIEKGRRSVSPERAVRWAKVLGYSPQRFIKLSLQDQLDQAGLRDFEVNVVNVKRTG